MTRQILDDITEAQLGDETRLRRVVAFFQRELGAIFGNAKVKRRNRKYEIDVAVYEKPLAAGRSYKMPPRQISEWIRQAANKAHPRLYKRLTVSTEPWQQGRISRKLFTAVKISVNADQEPVTTVEESLQSS